MRPPGRDDLDRAAGELASTLPPELGPLARVAFNYRWTWRPGGREPFASIDPELFERVREDPVRLLMEARPDRLRAAADDAGLTAAAAEAAAALDAELAAPDAEGSIGPVAFLCAEFGVHRSLHVYSGGLGVLAGDILKEASDRRLPYVGVGLLYAEGNFRQRIGSTGLQEDFWTPLLPDRMPLAAVTGADGEPLVVDVPIGSRTVAVRVWRADVGRTPLYLLDSRLPDNDRLDRWITSRLYVGDPQTRLEQYALLGIGGVRALRALGIDPAVFHLNEGHAALAPLEVAREAIATGAADDRSAALELARSRTVFTTHTPVPAGNERFDLDRLVAALGTPFEGWADDVAALGATAPLAGPGGERAEVGTTSLALRLSRTATGVSELHGRVSRRIWRPLFDAATDDEVPIGHVTNGVHVPTWLSDRMRALLDRHLGDGWLDRAADPATWAPVAAIPDAELWEARRAERADLVRWLRERDVEARLARYESRDAVEAALHAFDEDRLTIGFARRVAEYKRLPLLSRDLGRLQAILGGERSAQLAIAGKAHPRDHGAKALLATLFALPWDDPEVGARLAFVEDYDMSIAARLVAGCDVWLNVPRPPWEASGTSGMKAAMNGVVNCSVLDGWWAEAHDGANGFAIGEDANVDGVERGDEEARDAADAKALYDVLEHEVIPAFYDRDADGVPRRWTRIVKASLMTVGPRFSATRMLGDYAAHVYPAS